MRDSDFLAGQVTRGLGFVAQGPIIVPRRTSSEKTGLVGFWKEVGMHRWSRAVLAVVLFLPTTAMAAGTLDASLDVPVPIGTFNGIPYVQHNLRFNGSANGVNYQMNAWIMAPQEKTDANGRVLIEIMNTASLNLLGEVQLGRVHLGDEFLFSRGYVYATVRWDRKAINHPRRFQPNLPLDVLDPPTAPRSIGFSILSDFADAVRADALLKQLVGKVKYVYSYGYSQSARVQRQMLLQPPASAHTPIFDGSLMGGAGAVRLDLASDVDTNIPDPTPVSSTAGRVLAFNTEHEVIRVGAANVRQESTNYRVYELAGASHIPKHIAAVYANQNPTVGIPDTDTANPLDWTPSVRALFLALDRWQAHDQEPPASAWLGAAGDPTITRDVHGNAIGGIRFPDVEVGRGTYVAFDANYFILFQQTGAPGYNFRAISGSFADLSLNFTSHQEYVCGVVAQLKQLREAGYLLPADAAAIKQAARDSNIGGDGPAACQGDKRNE